MKINKKAKLFHLFIALLTLTCIGSLLPQNAYAASKRKKALKAYRKILNSTSKVGYYAEREWNTWSPEENQFAIIDTNKDHVPEMLITTSGGYQSRLLTYTKGKVKRVLEGFAGGEGTTGGFVFYPNKKLIYSKTIHGSGEFVYYRFNGKKAKLLCEKSCTAVDMPWENITTYRIKGKKASKAAYKKYVKKVRRKAKKKKVSFHRITSSNIRKYVK